MVDGWQNGTPDLPCPHCGSRVSLDHHGELVCCSEDGDCEAAWNPDGTALAGPDGEYVNGTGRREQV